MNKIAAITIVASVGLACIGLPTLLLPAVALLAAFALLRAAHRQKSVWLIGGQLIAAEILVGLSFVVPGVARWILLAAGIGAGADAIADHRSQGRAFACICAGALLVGYSADTGLAIVGGPLIAVGLYLSTLEPKPSRGEIPYRWVGVPFMGVAYVVGAFFGLSLAFSWSALVLLWIGILLSYQSLRLPKLRYFYLFLFIFCGAGTELLLSKQATSLAMGLALVPLGIYMNRIDGRFFALNAGMAGVFAVGYGFNHGESGWIAGTYGLFGLVLLYVWKTRIRTEGFASASGDSATQPRRAE